MINKRSTIIGILGLLLVAGISYTLHKKHLYQSTNTMKAAMVVQKKQPLKLAQEYPPANEEAATKEIIALLKERLEKDYPKETRTLRDAHPKQHGVVKAEFTVVDNLPEKYRVGIFKEPKTYKAWIRYSNLSGANGADINKDSRGMAIKLMGVPGNKILPDLASATTQDFVLMSTQFFVAKDVAAFAKLLRAINGGKIKTIFFFLTHIKFLRLFLKVRIQVPHLFDIPWGSTTPYLLGERAVKYAVLPQSVSKETIPTDQASPNYLRERMVKHLNETSIDLNFYIQEQVDADKMPVEDPRVTWDRKLSPFVKVANIRVLQQTFDSEKQQLYGDNLSFSPWHCLPEHRPLGGINRGRKAIYDTMSKFRHDRNQAETEEPTDWVDF